MLKAMVLIIAIFAILVSNVFSRIYFDVPKQDMVNQENKYELIDNNIKFITELIKNEHMDVKYPQLHDLNDKILQAKLNKLIYDKVFEFKSIYYKPEDEAKYDYWVEYSIAYNRGDIVSIAFRTYYGVKDWAHPVNGLKSITFNIKNGKVYTYDDLFKKNTDYRKNVGNFVKKYMKENGGYLYERFTGLDENQEFYLRDKSLIIYYQAYRYVSGYGPQEFEIPFEKIKELLKDELAK